MNKTYNEMTAEISHIVKYGGSFQNLRDQYLLEIKRIETFTAMFLKKYSSKIIGSKTNTPAWNLYEQKLKAYSDLSRALRQVEYFIYKEQNAKNQKSIQIQQ